MSKNRVLYVSIVAALLVGAFSLWQVASTKAAGSAQADRSYDAVESQRSFARGKPAVAALPLADRSYDDIESIRESRSASSNNNLSYDQIESIRQNRTTPDTLQQGDRCVANECWYKLPDGRWVR